MVEMEERELLLRSLKAYLEELKESGVDELSFRELPAPSGAVASEPAANEPVAKEAAAQEPVPTEPVVKERCHGVGNPAARLLFVMTVMTGSGFEGEAGGLLGKIVVAMGFATTDVFLLTFGASSAGGERPGRDELMKRIAAVGPEAIVTLGEEATQLLLQSDEPVQRLRGRFHDLAGIPLMPTLHPDAMLQNPALKREVWNDMQRVMSRLADPA